MDPVPESWNAKVRALYEHWLSIHPAEGVLPGRQHFDPLAVPKLLPSIWMCDIVRGGPELRFRYRLIGTCHVAAMRRDFTGQWMDEAHPHFRGSAIYEHYLRVAGGAPSWRRGAPVFHIDDRLFTMERVMVPLARDGREPDVILALTVYFRRSGEELG